MTTPTRLGAQTINYIAAGINEVVQGDFKEPIEKAIAGRIHSLDVAADHARAAVEQINQRARLQNWTVFGIILALGMALGGGVAHFFARQVSALNYLRLPAASSPHAHTYCRGHPYPAAEADREEAWAALKAGRGFDA